jgi:polyhydroxyalkanoate synthase
MTFTSPANSSLPPFLDRTDWEIWMSMFALADILRRAQGGTLERLGFGPANHSYRILASGAHWRLRDYSESGAGPPLLIVPAPIKRPYIWDLAPSASAVRYCQQHLPAFLLEWTPPLSAEGGAGLDEYANKAIGEAMAEVSKTSGGAKPFLMGHSLGGTFAAIFAALNPRSARGLVLLSSPLSFQPGTSRFRDALVAMAPSTLTETDIVPGSLISGLSALASPQTFVWSRLMDAASSLLDSRALGIHTRVERWTLDEVALPGRLVFETLQWLYRENRFFREALLIGERTVGPSQLTLPTLAVANTSDEIAPPASILPFIAAMPGPDARLIKYPGETGVGIQHFAILVGRRAYARVWPQIVSWLNARR